MAKYQKMGYRETLRWIMSNDDTDFLNDEEPIASVSVSLVADIFGHEVEKVMADLIRLNSPNAEMFER